MTLNNKGKAVLHALIRKAFAGLMIAGSFTVAGLPWTQDTGFGPPAWVVAQFIQPHHADCGLPLRPATASRSTVSAGSQRRIQGWWL